MKKWIFLIAFVGSAAHATFQIQDLGQVPTFKPQVVSAIQPETIYYSYRLTAFNDWTGTEKKILNLFPSFQPAKENPLMMYIAKISFAVDRPADKIDLRRFLDVQMIKTLDKTIEQESITPAEVVTYKDKKLEFRNPPRPDRWCSDTIHSICVHSNFTLPPPYNYAFALYETGKGSPYKTLQGQSEIRIANGTDVPNAVDLKTLSTVPTNPTGLLVQNMFWLTHAIEYIKVLGVVQPNPTAPEKSVVTGYLAFAIEKKTWDMAPLGFPMHDMILGRSGNTPDGILSGLPKLTQHLAISLADLIDR